MRAADALGLLKSKIDQVCKKHSWTPMYKNMGCGIMHGMMILEFYVFDYPTPKVSATFSGNVPVPGPSDFSGDIQGLARFIDDQVRKFASLVNTDRLRAAIVDKIKTSDVLKFPPTEKMRPSDFLDLSGQDRDLVNRASITLDGEFQCQGYRIRFDEHHPITGESGAFIVISHTA